MLHKRKNNTRRILENKYFIAQKLDNTDFSNSDIRGVDFSTSSLLNCNFTNTLAGQPFLWAYLFFSITLFLVAMSGFLAGFSGGFFSDFIFDNNAISSSIPDYLWILRLTSIVFLLLSLFVFTKYGYTRFLGIIVISFIVLFSIVFAVAVPSEMATIILAVFVLFFINSISLSVITLLSISIVILSKKRVAFHLFLLNLLYVFLAFLGYYFSIPKEQDIANELLYNVKIIFSILFSLFILIAANYISKKSIRRETGFKILSSIAHYISSIKGTSFKNCDLTHANFKKANLQSADFRQAKLTRTNWHRVKNLEDARVKGTYLANSKIRDLVVTKNALDANYDAYDLQGLNLEGANLENTSFIASNLSGSTLEGANLTNSKLVKTQLYQANLRKTDLTGAYIQGWVIATDTNLKNIKCDYIYTHLPTKDDPDPGRKPDNKKENFENGDFSDFIAPIIKTLNLYQQQYFDPRSLNNKNRTLDLFHHDSISPEAVAYAFQKIINTYPQAMIKLLAIESMGKEKVRLQLKIRGGLNRSNISEAYFKYYEIFLAKSDTKQRSLLLEASLKNTKIKQIMNMLRTAIEQPRFYVETHDMKSSIDIFISYSSNDREWIETLATALQSDGYKVWWDKELLPGHDYKNEIQQALDQAMCIIVAWSTSSVISSWVMAEANQGFDRKILIPLLFEDARIPVPFDSIQTADFRNWAKNKDSSLYQNLILAIDSKITKSP